MNIADALVVDVDDTLAALLERARVAEGEGMREEMEAHQSVYEASWLWDAPTILLPIRTHQGSPVTWA